MDTAGRQVRPGVWTRAAQTLLSASVLGFLLHWRYGYSAGHGDHWVLSAQGLNWADPTKFDNDWLIRNAPQPHWFFDVVTWFGASIGQLGAVYLAYWVISLAVFGGATVLLAHKWAPAHPWVATLLVTVLGAITPWWLLGTGSPMLAIALPGVLAGFLIYLVIAALLTGRYRMAGIVSVITAVVHVQQGGVAVVLLLSVAIVSFVRFRKADWWLLGSAATSAVVVLAGLKARPVAGNMSDFAQACKVLIPYHCEATSWPAPVLLQGVALVGLALMSVLYMNRTSWPVWAATLGLSAFGLLAGVAVDRWDVLGLDVLAQGLNIYRLDVLLMPFAVWGVLAPVFGKVKEWQRWVALGVALFLGYQVLATTFSEGMYSVRQNHGGPWFIVVGVALILACAWAVRAELVVRVAAAVMSIAVVMAFATNSSMKLREFDPTFIPDDDLRAWGEDVHRVVPPGEPLIVPPLALYARLVTGRGVVADCKGGPYGGPAWQEYQRRIEDLGGFRQCVEVVRPEVYRRLTPDQFEAVARRYGSRYIMFEDGENQALPELRRRGWHEVVGPRGSVINFVYQAPDST